MLHAFARYVAGDGWIFRFAGDFVDFVDVDDATLGAFDVVSCRLDEFEQDVFYVFTYVSGFSERGGVSNCEWNIEHFGERLCQIGFPGSSWPHQEDVGLADFNVVW